MMAKYLYFDGVDDYLKTPSLTFTKVEMLFEITEKIGGANYVNGGGSTGDFVGRNSQNTAEQINNFTATIKGISVTNSKDIIVANERALIIANYTRSPNILTFMGRTAYGGSAFGCGKIFYIKVYNGDTLVAYYDMSTGTVDDQSGNGNHATIIGATWVEEPQQNRYLSMDGVDDYIKTPLPIGTRYVEIKLQRYEDSGYLFDARTTNIPYWLHNSYDGLNGYQIDGGSISYNYNFDGLSKERVTTVLVHLASSVATQGDMTFFSRYSTGTNTSEYLGVDIYEIKLYDINMNILSHYDMSTETVLDQSGNGNHATLKGGTWSSKPTYLVLDGVDDAIKIPSVTFDTIEMDVYVESVQNNQYPYLMDARSGSNGYISNAYTPVGSSITTMYIDGISVQKDWASIPKDKRIVLKAEFDAVYTDNVNFFTDQYGTNWFTKAKAYGIKFYNDTNLVAYYDMSTGTVLDRSGNGNHATLVGGTWVEDTGGTTPEPSLPPGVTIVSVDMEVLSDEATKDRAVVKFTFDSDVTAWEVRVLGSGQGTGTLADSGGAVLANTEIQAVIDWTELYQEGDNRINIYGQSAAGWTPFQT